MSTPRTKRQFAGAAADPAQRQITSFFSAKSSGDVSSSTEPLRGPVLPSSVQANLLSVGMRVRKSVPEGYKTAGSSAFKLWTDNTAPLTMTNAKVAPAARSVSRELLPFCGINKVGGMDTQPEFQYEEDEVPELDAVPELTMSQESTDSIIEPSRKRFFDEDEEFNGDRELSPIGGNARAMAIPRTRMGKDRLGQENMALDGNDFEEAQFLEFGAGQQTDF
ncbi:hypothetical protein PT974_09453 [Cladobotryum mycophilum]|uniref:Uncharacterized protein n=1 Tax=Cladobotryum mycophilum TaxID=491253 RepID=A0ABR0SHG7_9HYPO